MTSYTKITLDGRPVLDADSLVSQLSSVPAWAEEINSLTLVHGESPGQGCFLLSRSDYDEVNKSGTVDIAWTRGESGTAEKTVTFKGYVVIDAFAAANVVGSPVVVRVADLRHLYAMGPWRRVGPQERFTYRWATPPLIGESNHGEEPVITPWGTYIAARIFEAANLHSFRSLRTSGVGNRRLTNADFTGLTPWEACNEALALIGCVACYDPFEEQPYAVLCGSGQDEWADFQTANARSLVQSDDLQPLAYAHIPEKVIILAKWQAVCSVSTLAPYPLLFEFDTEEPDALPGSEIMVPSHLVAIFNGRFGVSPQLHQWHTTQNHRPEFPYSPDAQSSIANYEELEEEAAFLADLVIDDLRRKARPSSDTYVGLFDDVLPGAEINEVRFRVSSNETFTTFRRGPIAGATLKAAKRAFERHQPFNGVFRAQVLSDGIPAVGNGECEIRSTVLASSHNANIMGDPSWTPPTDPNGTITAYNWGVKPIPAGSHVLVAVVSGVPTVIQVLFKDTWETLS